MEEIGCPRGYLMVLGAFHRTQVMIYTHVHDMQFKTMLATEHIHTATAMGEVYHLLPRHLTWRYAYSLLLDAIVTAISYGVRMGIGAIS